MTIDSTRIFWKTKLCKALEPEFGDRSKLSLGIIVVDVYATGVINDPVEFAIFAYVETWAGLGGWGGDDDVSFTCTHVTCYALDFSCTCTHVTCYASHGEGWVRGVGMMTFLSLAHM